MKKASTQSVPLTESVGLLDELADRSAAERQGSSSAALPVGDWVGTVVDADHPTLVGRVRVTWEGAGPNAARWMPALTHLSIREGDRVLVSSPKFLDEPVVGGVLDGFRRRPEPTREQKMGLTLERDETIQVLTREGSPLLSLHYEDTGPVVRLLDNDVNLEMEGRLRLSAKSIAFAAREGGIDIEANDDVRIAGEMVKLN